MPYNDQKLVRWTGNSESDMDHYRVYSGQITRIYNAFLATTGLSGLGTTGEPGLYATGLPNGVLSYLAVTAFDTAGNESTFSAEVSTLVTVPLLHVLKQFAA